MSLKELENLLKPAFEKYSEKWNLLTQSFIDMLIQ